MADDNPNDNDDNDDTEKAATGTYDWSALYDAEGNIYYYNSVTEETTWDEPSEPYNPPEKDLEEIKAAQGKGTWEKHTDEEGNVYYYNTETEVTTWDKPDGFKEDDNDNNDDDDNKNDNDDDDDDDDDEEEEDDEPPKIKQEPDKDTQEEELEEEPLPSSPIGGGGADDDDDDDEQEPALPSSPIGSGDDDDDDDDDDDGKVAVKQEESVWERHTTDDGEVYYYNTQTDETTWDRPADFVESTKSEADKDDDDNDDDASSSSDEDKNNKNNKNNKNKSQKDSTKDKQKDQVKSIKNEKQVNEAAWEKLTDDDGNVYYYNSVTEVTQWEKPDDLIDNDDDNKSDKDATALPSPKSEVIVKEEPTTTTTTSTTKSSSSEKGGTWEKLFTDEGRPYYYNSVTDVTQWDKPDDFVETTGEQAEKGSAAPKKEKGAAAVAASVAASATASKGQWEKVTADGGKTYYYYNATTEVTQWEKPDDFDDHDDDDDDDKDKKEEFSSSPIAASPGSPGGKGKWEKYTDSEGNTYYYNADSGETQWEPPEGFIDQDDQDEKKADEKDEFQPSPERSPSPEAMDVEDDQAVKVKEEEPKEEEIDPAVKRVRDAEEALNKPDSVLEPGCTANVLEVVSSHGNPEKAILALIDNFQGQTAICGTLAKWLADLRSSSTNSENVNEVVGTARQSVADEIRETAQDVVSLIAKERFSKTGGDSILNLSKSEAAFLEDMIESNRWRKLLIDLSATNKDSAVLMYCIRAISKRGYHRELVKRMNPSEYFSVFNAMLQSELAVVGKTSVSASSDVDTSIGLEELVNDLRRTCTATAFTYLYSIEVLRHLVTMAEAEDATNPSEKKPSRFRRAIRKWERLSQDLDCSMVDPSTSSSTAGSSPLFRKRRLDVALTISELHQRQRRRHKPSSDDDEVKPVANGDQQKKAMESGLLNFLRRYSVGTQVDDRVLDALLPTGLYMQTAADEVGELLIAYPLAVRALLSNMFKTGSSRTPASTKSKCARLVALAALASEKKARAEVGATVGEENEESPDEVALTRMLVQGCQLCEEVALMASFVVVSDGEKKGTLASPGQQLCNLALKNASVAQGVIMWAHEIVKGNEYTSTATYPTFSPSILSLVRIVALRHPCTRLEAAEIAFTFLRHSTTSEISYKKINEIKEQSLRLLLFLLVNGEAPSILRSMTSRLQQAEAIKLDASLLRYFISGILEVVRPPFSLPFVRLLGAVLKSPRVMEAVRSTYFGEANQERLKTLLSNFQESCSPEQGTATKGDVALVAFLSKTYINSS